MEFLLLRGPQSGRCRPGLFHHCARTADACNDVDGIGVCRDDRAVAGCTAACRLRHRLLHPVRIHRHLHIRQFRSGSTTAVAEHDGPRLRLLRLPAVGGHHVAGWQSGVAPRNASDDLGLARHRRGRLAADVGPAPGRGPRRDGSGRKRHLFRASGDRIRRTGCGCKPRHRQRHLSRLLFLRWARRHRRPRPAVRRVWLACLRWPGWAWRSLSRPC